jgi:putative toxin-antitoxin system antitoxin component (TIGR02293 family)
MRIVEMAMTVSQTKKATRGTPTKAAATRAPNPGQVETALAVKKLTRLAPLAAKTIEAGLPVSVVESLLEMGLSTTEVHELVVKPRTLSHRRDRGQPLSIDESDRAVRVVRIIELATDAFADKDKAMRWLRKPKRRFEGRAPMDMLLTETGGRLVEEMLTQIDEGMVA